MAPATAPPLTCPPRPQVAIKKPSKREAPNPTAYYTRKGIYALNVQAIADATGRVTWASIRTHPVAHTACATTAPWHAARGCRLWSSRRRERSVGGCVVRGNADGCAAYRCD